MHELKSPTLQCRDNQGQSTQSNLIAFSGVTKMW